MATYYFRNNTTTWNTAANWSLNDGGTANGAIPTAADDAYFTNSSTNCTVNSAGMVCRTLIFSGVGGGNYSNTFTLTNTLTVSGNITLSPTMTFTGSSTLTINATSSITSNNIPLTCNLTISGARNITLVDDLTVNRNIQTTGAVGNLVNFNNNTLYVGGTFGSFNIGMSIGGSSNITMNGTGVFSVSTAFSAYFGITGTLSFDTTGVITINSTSFLAGASGMNVRYVKGTVVIPRTQNCHFAASNNGTLNLDMKGVSIYGTVNLGTVGTMNLLSDFVVDGGVVNLGSTIIPNNQPLTINNNGGNLIFGGTELPSLIQGNSFGSLASGNATWYFRGGGNCVLIGHNLGYVYPSLVFDHTGTVTFRNGNYLGSETSALIFGSGFTYSYIKGKLATEGFTNIKNRGTLSIGSSCNLIGFDKANGLNNISIANGITLTMDKFFSGRSGLITNVVCSTTTGAYTISFQDGTEKLANWVRVSNCTISRRGQLLILNQKATTGTGRNIGVRYQNVWPNGLPKDSPFTSDNPMAYGAGGLVSDPTIAL